MMAGDGTDKEDDVTNGSTSVSAGVVVSQDSNFTDMTSSSGNQTDHEQSNSPGGAGPAPTTGIPTNALPSGSPSPTYTPSSDSWYSDYSYTDTENDVTSGMSSSANDTVSTSDGFNDSGTTNESSDYWNSGVWSFNTGYGSGQSTNTSSTNYNDSETDSSDGSDDDGVTTDNYTANGTITDNNQTSWSFTGTYTGTDGSSENVQSSGSGDENDWTTSTETGDYTTEPPGKALPPTQDNPDGDLLARLARPL